MHICLISDYFPPHIGGIEQLFGDLTEHFLKKWYKVTILTTHSTSRIQQDSAFTLYHIGSSRKYFLFHLLYFGAKHRKLFQSFDHIHTTTFAAAIGGNILAKIYQKPITITIHEIYDLQRDYLKGSIVGRRYRLYEYILCQILNRTHIITPSDFTKSRLQLIHHIPEDHITVIPNQIDYEFWSDKKEIENIEIYWNKKKDSFSLINKNSKIIFVWRLWKEKGLTWLLDSLPVVIGQIPNLILTIIAPKTPRIYNKKTQKQIFDTRKQIKDSRLQRHIRRIDPVSTIELLRKEINNNTIGIAPSLSEWFCYTAVHMEICNLNLVVSDIPTFHEVLMDDGRHTFVTWGQIESLSKAIIQQIQFPQKWTKEIDRKFEDSLSAYNDLISLGSMKFNT